MARRILHIDMDAFFAAVEVARNPSLRGKPLIIGGNREDLRGVVSTASYEARVFGVHSAMPLAEARRRCPQGVFMRGDHAAYRAVSRQVREILESVSPVVQMASIDEAYIDVTGSVALFGGDDAIAAHLKGRIRAELGLPCTVAIAPNRLVAKIASAEAKPDGYHRVDAGAEAAYLAPLAVSKLPGAGPTTCAALERLGIATLGALAATPPRSLEAALGENTARWLLRAARGEGGDTVETDQRPKQISRETTFQEDLRDWAELERVLADLLAHCMFSLRAQGLEAGRLTLKVRYADFETKTFAATLAEPTALDPAARDTLRALMPKARARRAPVRLVGVALGNLVEGQHQLRLFDGERDQRWEQVLDKVDSIRGKHGFASLRSARSLDPARDKPKPG